jgi:hypothetical protein
MGEAGPVRRSWDGWARFKTEIDFQISNEFGFWQDFEKFYKEIWKKFRHWGFFLNSSRLLKDF